MTLTEMRNALASGQTTSEALVRDCLAAIDAKNDKIFAFVRVFAHDAMSAAHASDMRRKEGKTVGALDGIPVAIKDNFSYKDHIVSAGSNILKDYVAPYNATAVNKLLDAGAVIVGITNMDEFAMGSSTESSAFGTTKNPHDVTRVPGGSSGGAAAAIAAELVPLSYGSDTGGSIRQPAAFCGVVGLKPTYGAVSRYGLLAMASSLDQIGPFAATIEDVELGLETVAGHDAGDSTSQTPVWLPKQEKYRIGVANQFLADGLDTRIRERFDASIAALESAGHTIVRDIDIPELDLSIATYYLLMPAEVSSNLARFDGIRFGTHEATVPASRAKGFGTEVKRRIMLGTYALSAGYADQYYKRAQAAQAALRTRVLTVLEDVDMLLSPTTPELPFAIGAKSDDPLAMYLSDIYTVYANLAGLPGISIPAGTVPEAGKSLPVGMQLVGKPWGEQQICDAGRVIEAKGKEWS